MICHVCASSNNHKKFQIREMMFGFREEFTYFECSNCGGLQILEIPENLSEYYPQKYCSFQPYSNELGFISRFFRIRRDRFSLFGRNILGYLWHKKFPNKRLRHISKLDIQLDYNSKILDVGCGSGKFLYILKEAGFKNLIGIDPFLPEESDKDGVKLLKKDIFSFEDRSQFSLINFSHSLEHMPNQVDTLVKAATLLLPTGICLVSIPVKTDYIWNRYGVHWASIDAPRHFFIHTVKSFKYLAEKANLIIKLIDFDSGIFQFWASEQYKKDIPLTAKNSYAENPANSIFTEKQIEDYKKLSNELNANNQGDQATFYLVKSRK